MELFKSLSTRTKLFEDPLKKGSVIIGFMSPFKYIHNIQALAERELTTFSMELVTGKAASRKHAATLSSRAAKKSWLRTMSSTCVRLLRNWTEKVKMALCSFTLWSFSSRKSKYIFR